MVFIVNNDFGIILQLGIPCIEPLLALAFIGHACKDKVLNVLVNDHVLVAKGFPKTKALIEENGYNIVELDVSEFQKLDGGLSCLSLRF